MISPADLLEQVRRRAGYACEYCGVSEADSGGLLTQDHFQPKSASGFDDLENLVYCCFRCNLYKADYWMKSPLDFNLWNPRAERSDKHFTILEDGLLKPLSEVGAATIQRLRLNRPQLVAYRIRKRRQVDSLLLTQELKAIALGLVEVQRYQNFLLDEQRRLLEELRRLLQEPGNRDST